MPTHIARTWRWRLRWVHPTAVDGWSYDNPQYTQVLASAKSETRRPPRPHSTALYDHPWYLREVELCGSGGGLATELAVKGVAPARRVHVRVGDIGISLSID